MAQPVTHFEVQGKDGKRLQQFYAQLFDWKIDANNPMEYGMIDTGGKGINGGIGGNGPSEEHSRVTFYVEVSDLQAALDKAEKLGGKTLMPITEIPGAVTMAMFADPEGNTVGLIKG